MAKRRNDTELNRDNVGSFLQDEGSRSRQAAEPTASFDRADPAELQNRRMVRVRPGAAFAASSPPEGSSNNPFQNIRLVASSSSVPSSSTSRAQLLQQHRERVQQWVNRSANEEHIGSWMGMMIKFSKALDRLSPVRDPLHRSHPPLPPVAPVASAPPPPSPIASAVGVTFGSFAPKPVPAPAVALPPSTAPVASDRPDDDAEAGFEEGEKSVVPVADPDWRDFGEFGPVRLERGTADGEFANVGNGRLQLQQPVTQTHPRLILRDAFGMRTLLVVRLSRGESFTLRVSEASKPGKKPRGFIFFVSTTERGVEKLRIRMTMPEAAELHQKLQELVR